VSELAINVQDVLKGRLPDKISADEKRYLKAMESIYPESIEVLLNSYELARQMAILRNLDKDSFRYQYQQDIHRICTSEQAAFKGKLHPDVTSEYQAIWALYREWKK
jgi:hypothetical protein